MHGARIAVLEAAVKITSSAFHDGTSIPTRYAHRGVTGGNNLSLPFSWNDKPAETKSFALSIIDPHPVAKNWVHWFVINIPAEINELTEGASQRSMPNGCRELRSTYGTIGYGGPEPPKGSGVHPYVVTLFALRIDALNLHEKSTLKEFTTAIEEVVIEHAIMTGYYER